jgi:putative ABC transport system permease protein
MLAEQVRNNITIAIDTLRANKLRSGLTILGVVIGVSTVMMMAAIVQGIKEQIVRTIEVAGPTTFYVMKVNSSTPVNPDRLPAWIRIRPDLTEAEARRIQALPEISYAAIWGQTVARLEYKGQRTQALAVNGADDRFVEVQGGDLVQGRWFTKPELIAGAPVAVLEETAARKIFGAESILDKQVQIGGRPATVIGVYQKAENIFEPPGQGTGAIVPYEWLDHQFKLDKTNAVFIPVKPKKGVSAADAQEAVTIALREMR